MIPTVSRGRSDLPVDWICTHGNRCSSASPEGLGSRPYRLGLRLAGALEQVMHDLDADERKIAMGGFRDYMVPRCNPGCARCAERPTKWIEADALLQQILGL